MSQQFLDRERLLDNKCRLLENNPGLLENKRHLLNEDDFGYFIE